MQWSSLQLPTISSMLRLHNSRPSSPTTTGTRRQKWRLRQRHSRKTPARAAQPSSSTRHSSPSDDLCNPPILPRLHSDILTSTFCFPLSPDLFAPYAAEHLRSFALCVLVLCRAYPDHAYGPCIPFPWSLFTCLFFPSPSLPAATISQWWLSYTTSVALVVFLVSFRGLGFCLSVWGLFSALKGCVFPSQRKRWRWGRLRGSLLLLLLLHFSVFYLLFHLFFRLLIHFVLLGHGSSPCVLWGAF